MLVRPRAAVQAARELVVGIMRREHTWLVTGSGQLSRERLDVSSDSAGVGPGIRRDECDAHN
jgi:hypothetical protein